MAKDVPGTPGPRTPESFLIVGIGASAGGLEAYSELLQHLPVDTGMGFVLVQHLDPEHESALASLLSRKTKMPVIEVTQNLRVQPNHVYVIPPNTQLSIERGVLKLVPRGSARVPHQPINFFFESLSQDQRERAIGVVLSGTATDGTLGLEAIKAEAGITFAQDDSARYDSMPRSAVAAGCTDFVLSPQGIAHELARIARHPYVAQINGAGTASDPSAGAPGEDLAQTAAHEVGAEAKSTTGHGPPRLDRKPARTEAARSPAQTGDEGYKKILLHLRSHSGVDFSLYKVATIQRRINRRILLTQHTGLKDYGDFLRGNAKELDALYADVLISVTSFFRNPDAFEVLQTKVLSKLLAQRADAPLRIWVLGCSTGQEAYSIAMSFTECAEKMVRARKLQIFATDLNETLLEKARHGLYAKSLAQDVSPERLRRFFVEEQGGYRIIKPLREMIVFARQNLIGDPPFSRMDLICCRNLMIYLEPSLQKKALPTFHYALKPGGYLFLGASESVAGFTDLFEPLDKKQKIFFKKASAPTGFHLPVNLSSGAAVAPAHRPLPPLKMKQAQAALPDDFRSELSAQREADRVTVNQFAPPSVLVNDQLQVLQFRGPTGAYLQPPAGKASFDLLKMTREGLMLPLRAAIVQARKDNKSVRRENLRMEKNGGTRRVNLEVIPLKNLRERCFLVLFEDTSKVAGKSARPAPLPSLPPSARAESATRRRNAELETELVETRDFVQSMQEQHEAANEELQASSEEAQSANEELQSVNEELETSKEELESANEELTTVNEEMSHRNAELSRLNNDLTNLQASAQLAIVLLGRDLTIRRFSPQAEKQFSLLATDLGRPIGHVRHTLELPDLEALVSEVISSMREAEREVRDKDGRWYSLRVRPYLSHDNKIDGATLVLVDIQALKHSEQTIVAARDFAEAIIRTAHDPLLILNDDLRVHSANEAFYRTFQVTQEESTGRRVYELGNRQWDIPKLHELLEDILPRKSVFDDFEVTHKFETIGWRSMLLNARRVDAAAGQPARILLGIRDVTEHVKSEQSLRDVAKSKDDFMAMLAHELRGPLAPLSNALEIMRQAGDINDTSRLVREMAARQLQHMVRLIDDLLDASRISSGKLILRNQQVELASVVYQVVEALHPALDAVKHELTVSLPPEPVYLYADAVRLAQIFSNLLTNSCKYTEPGGNIRFSAVHQGDEVVITVADNGIGISPELMPQLFEMFRQADQGMARTQGGLGIGLSLVKKLVEMHGGSVTANSAGLDQGTEIVVRMPAVAQGLVQAPPSAPQTVSTAPESARRILVVDDNRDSAHTLALWLNLNGHITQTAHDGVEAVSMAESFNPEIVLLDLGLPRIDGYEAARQIRSQPWGKTMHLVALTGWGQAEDRRKSKEAGFNAHLVKPVDTVVLAKLMADLQTGAAGRQTGG